MRKLYIIIWLVLSFNRGMAQYYQTQYDGLPYVLNGESYASNLTKKLHETESYFLQSYITMYKASNEIKYLNLFVIHAKRVQERRDDNIANLLPDGINFNSDSCVIDAAKIQLINTNKKGWTVMDKDCFIIDPPVLHSASLTFPMAEFIYLIKTSPALQNELLPNEAAGTYLDANNLITYLDFANWLQGRVNETIQFHESYWCPSSASGTGYRRVPGTACGDRVELNMQCAMGRSLAMMYLVESLPDGNSIFATLYLAKISSIANLVYAELQTFSYDANAYTWQHQWIGNANNNTTIEDITHAWAIMGFADICFTHDIPDANNKYFWSTDMQKFANTLANHIYNNPLVFGLNTAGTNVVNPNQMSNPSTYNPLQALGPYVFLSKYNPDIYQMLSDAYYKYPSTIGAVSAYPQLALYQNVFNPVGVRRNTFSDSHWAACAGGNFRTNDEGNEEFATLRNKDGNIEVYSIDNTGAIEQLYVCPNTYPAAWAGIVTGNFDATEEDEIIGINNYNNTLYAFKISSQTIAEIAQITTAYSDWKGIAIGDVVSSNSGNEIAVLKDNGLVSFYKLIDNQFTLIANEQTNIGATAGIAIGELDIDVPGNEIAIINNSNGHLNIYKLDNSNGYSLQLINSFTATNGTYNDWNGLTRGDFDNDGIDEIVAHRNYDGDFFVFKITDGQLQNNYIEYFPNDTQHGVMGTMKYKGKDALLALRNYDGNMFAFTLEGYCPGMDMSANITQDNSNDNLYSNVNNNYTIDYKSNNILTASNMSISTDGTETVKAQFISGKEIIFKTGFNANEGIIMDAYIDNVYLGCDNNFNLKMAHQFNNLQANNQTQNSGNLPKKIEQTIEKKEAVQLVIQINPNPNNGIFTIQLNKQINQGKVIIYDCLSKPIASYNMSNNTSFEIDISNQAKGIYLVQFITDEYSTIKRIVKN